MFFSKNSNPCTVSYLFNTLFSILPLINKKLFHERRAILQINAQRKKISRLHRISITIIVEFWFILLLLTDICQRFFVFTSPYLFPCIFVFFFLFLHDHGTADLRDLSSRRLQNYVARTMSISKKKPFYSFNMPQGERGKNCLILNDLVRNRVTPRRCRRRGLVKRKFRRGGASCARSPAANRHPSPRWSPAYIMHFSIHCKPARLHSLRDFIMDVV